MGWLFGWNASVDECLQGVYNHIDGKNSISHNRFDGFGVYCELNLSTMVKDLGTSHPYCSGFHGFDVLLELTLSTMMKDLEKSHAYRSELAAKLFKSCSQCAGTLGSYLLRRLLRSGGK